MVETLAAAALLVLLAVLHSVVGERHLVGPLVRLPDLPAVLGSTRRTAGTIRFAWHLTSVLGLGLAAVLVLVALDAGAPAVLAAVGVTCWASAALPLVLTRGRHLSWTAFVAAGVLALVAAAVA